MAWTITRAPLRLKTLVPPVRDRWMTNAARRAPLDNSGPKRAASPGRGPGRVLAARGAPPPRMPLYKAETQYSEVRLRSIGHATPRSEAAEEVDELLAGFFAVGPAGRPKRRLVHAA
jgi:hypothetical protein